MNCTACNRWSSNSKIFDPKIFRLHGSIGRAVDFRSRGPWFDSRLSFLKVWAKKFLPWEDFNSWFSWTLRHQISWFGHSCAWFLTFCGNPFWRGVWRKNCQEIQKSSSPGIQRFFTYLTYNVCIWGAYRFHI